MAWIQNVYNNIESMCLDVDLILQQESLKYKDQLQSVGANVKKFCLDIVQDVLPQLSENAVDNAASSSYSVEKTDKDDKICKESITHDHFEIEPCNESHLLHSCSVEPIKAAQYEWSLEEMVVAEMYEKSMASFKENHSEEKQAPFEMSYTAEVRAPSTSVLSPTSYALPESNSFAEEGASSTSVLSPNSYDLLDSNSLAEVILTDVTSPKSVKLVDPCDCGCPPSYPSISAPCPSSSDLLEKSNSVTEVIPIDMPSQKSVSEVLELGFPSTNFIFTVPSSTSYDPQEKSNSCTEVISMDVLSQTIIDLANSCETEDSEVGVAPRDASVASIITGQSDNSIEDAANLGSSFKVKLDGSCFLIDCNDSSVSCEAEHLRPDKEKLENVLDTERIVSKQDYCQNVASYGNHDLESRKQKESFASSVIALSESEDELSDSDWVIV